MVEKKFINVLTLLVLMLSSFGANTRCSSILHDIEKNKALDKLKKY